MEIHDGLCTLFGSRNPFEPISRERGDRNINEPDPELGEFGCNFV